MKFDTDKTIDESLLKLNRSNMEFKENSKLIPEALDEEFPGVGTFEEKMSKLPLEK